MDAQRLYDLLREAWDKGFIEAQPRPYSGRFMYGERCIAIETSGDEGPLQIGFALGRLCSEDEELPSRTYSDSLGYGGIVYWRDLLWNPHTMEDPQ